MSHRFTNDEKLQMYAAIIQLSQVLKETQMWSETRPSEVALASTEPFALDHLAPEEWLQWIFIPKFKALLDAKSPLPAMAITPYLEEALKEHIALPSLVVPLQRLETLLQRNA